jgi:hypothetical protein
MLRDTDPTFQVDYGARPTKNHLYVSLSGYGRNTYGAVLRHSYRCNLTCKQEKPCQMNGITED